MGTGPQDRAESAIGLSSRAVLLGGLDRLDTLIDGLSRGAAAAINADLPYPELVRLADRALRFIPGAADREHLYARLVERKREHDKFGQLTDREAAVLAGLAQGLSALDIARQRPVALATVRSQIMAILRKLDVPSQAAAVALTYRACGDDRIVPALRLHQNY